MARKIFIISIMVFALCFGLVCPVMAAVDPASLVLTGIDTAASMASYFMTLPDNALSGNNLAWLPMNNPKGLINVHSEIINFENVIPQMKRLNSSALFNTIGQVRAEEVPNNWYFWNLGFDFDSILTDVVYPINIEIIHEVGGISHLWTDYLMPDRPSNYDGWKSGGEINKAMKSSIEYYRGHDVYYIVNHDFDDEYGYGAVLCTRLGQPIIYCPDMVNVAPEPYKVFENNTSLAANSENNYYSNRTSTDSHDIYEGDTTTTINNNDYSTIKYGDDITTYTYDQSQNTTIDRVLNFSDGTAAAFDGGIINFDQREEINDFYYDYSSKQYYYRAGDTVYNLTFYNNYTYINYIGSSAIYEPEQYKIYFELPDGRSSSQMTREEIYGMSIQFADVVPYESANTNEHMLGLYHLDGNTDNSSGFADSDFVWKQNASITYMESSSGFEGALYIPNTSTSPSTFTINLPEPVTLSRTNGQHLTVSFRYYNYADIADMNNVAFSVSFNSRYGAVGFMGSGICGMNYISNYTNSSYRFYHCLEPGVWNYITLDYYYKDSIDYGITLSCDVYVNGVYVGYLQDLYYDYSGSFNFSAPSGTSSSISSFCFSTTISSNSSYSSSKPTSSSYLKFNIPFMLDEIMITDTSLVPSVPSVPWDDGYFYILPDSTNLLNNTIAVDCDYLSGNYRIGGIRPSMVEKGYMWCQITSGRITSCQVYNGHMWEEHECYIWTNGHWVSAPYFDVITFFDYTDIKDNPVNTPITSDQGYYDWYQEAFRNLHNDMNERFYNMIELAQITKDAVLEIAENGGSGGSGGGGSVASPILSGNEINFEIDADNTMNFDVDINPAEYLADAAPEISGLFSWLFNLLSAFDFSNIHNFTDFYEDTWLGVDDLSVY